MESTDFSRRKEFYDDRGEAISLHSMTPSISSSVSSRSSLSSQTHSTVDVPIFLDPEVLVFCDDPHATGPRKLALKLYNPNDFHIRFESKFSTLLVFLLNLKDFIIGFLLQLKAQTVNVTPSASQLERYKTKAGKN